MNAADDLTRFTGFQTLTIQLWWCTGPEFLLQDNIKSVHLNLTKTASVTLDELTNPFVQLESNADKITKNKIELMQAFLTANQISENNTS